MAKENEVLAEGTPAKEIMVTRIVNAPRSLVFDTWTKPEHLVHWWGSNKCKLQFCEVDLRPGGTFRFCMGVPGEYEIWVSGIYHEITPPECLVFRCGLENEEKSHEAMWRVTFEDGGGKTRLTVHQVVFDNAHARADAKEGMIESLEALDTHLEQVLAATPVT
jgi:uncharacterized protein YndB with AHSA1/START domain